MDEELQALYRAVQADPGDFAAWVALVRLLIRLGRTTEAEAVLDEMIRRFGVDAVAELAAASGLELIFIITGAVTEVVILFGAGLALPASRWGKLTLDDDADRDKFFELIIELYKRHIRERNAYRNGDRSRSITQLWADADYLWRLVQAFLRRYPDHDSASLLRMIERAAGGWVDEYWRQDDSWYMPEPPPARIPLPTPPPPSPCPPPPAEHPHTVERPRSYEDWLKEQAKSEAQRKREHIARIRERIRELMRKRRDPRLRL
jgi:pentatricopeptide repeat protein